MEGYFDMKSAFNPYLDTNVMEGYFDTEYFISGFRNLRPLWRGLGKSQIYYTPATASWRLESLYDTNKVMTKSMD